MKFRMTPTQKKIMEAFWERKKLFTPSSLVKRGICHTLLGARTSLHCMERKHQVIQKGEKGDEPLYCGTTVNKEEFRRLWEEWKTYENPLIITENQLPGGLNEFERAEREEELEEAISVIERKKAEIRARGKRE